MYSLHGLSDDKGFTEQDDVVLEPVPGERVAVFELNLHGNGVARIGLELEEGMAATAAARSGKKKAESASFRDRMIWFEKVSMTEPVYPVARGRVGSR